MTLAPPPADLTTVTRSLPPATSWLTHVPASRGMGEGLMPRGAGRGRRTQATAKAFQRLGAGSRGWRRSGPAPSGLRKCREVRITEWLLRP